MPVNEKSAGEVRSGIEYARVGGQSLQFDAYLPEGTGPFPMSIVVHGGGWVGGDRYRNVGPLFRPLVEGGFVCVSISYRLARDMFHLGAAVEDVEQAIEYFQAHSAEFKGSREKIALVGESAGGHLAAMTALRKNESAVKAVVGLFAPTDLEQLARGSEFLPEQFRRGVLGTPWERTVLDRMRDFSPVHHLRSGMPPFLLIHGTADALVPFEQSRNMCRAIRNAGGACDLLAVNGGEHGLRRWESAGLTSYKRIMTDWLRKRLA
jgi:acetyl esterase